MTSAMPETCDLTGAIWPNGNAVLATVPAVKPAGWLVIPSQQYRSAGERGAQAGRRAAGAEGDR